MPFWWFEFKNKKTQSKPKDNWFKRMLKILKR